MFRRREGRRGGEKGGQDDEKNGGNRVHKVVGGIVVVEGIVVGINRNKRGMMYKHVSCMAIALNGTYDSYTENNVA